MKEENEVPWFRERFVNTFTIQQLSSQETKTQHGGYEQAKTIHVLVNADLSFSRRFSEKKYFKKLNDYYSSSEDF